MPTTIRPELSQDNKYYVEKHRYYELKHFCLQYPVWKKAYISLDNVTQRHPNMANHIKTNTITNQTMTLAVARASYKEKMEMIESTANEADSYLSEYILKGVTEGLSYTYLKNKLDMPCSRDTYYDRYRKFFWLLNKKRD